MQSENRIMNLTLFVTSIILFLFSLFLTSLDIIKEKNSSKTTAIIKEVTIEKNKYHIKAEYKVEQETYIEELTLKEEVTVNDSIVIKYDKKNPQKTIRNDHLILLSFTFTISILLFTVNVKDVITNYKEKKLKKELLIKNNVLNLPITNIFINNKAPKKKNKYPYRIRLTLEKEGQSSIFETKDLYMDIEHILASKNINTLPVYIDEQNEKKYYIDLSNLL